MGRPSVITSAAELKVNLHPTEAPRPQTHATRQESGVGTLKTSPRVGAFWKDRKKLLET